MNLCCMWADCLNDAPCVFFFSSRRRHTRCLSDWSSDVCSSDLWPPRPAARALSYVTEGESKPSEKASSFQGCMATLGGHRSEERRVGKECRSRGWAYDYKQRG